MRVDDAGYFLLASYLYFILPATAAPRGQTIIRWSRNVVSSSSLGDIMWYVPCSCFGCRVVIQIRMIHFAEAI